MSVVLNMNEKDDEDMHESVSIEMNNNISKWNSTIEKMLKNISFKSDIYKREHYRITQTTNSRFSMLMITILVLSPLPAFVSIARSYLERDNEYDLVFTMTSSLISFTSSILISILKFSKFENKINEHKIATIKYRALSNNINRQLSLLRENRISAQEYLDWIIKKYDDLNAASPLLDVETSNVHTEEVDEDVHKEIHKELSNDSIHDIFKNVYDDSTMNYELSRFTSHA
jgi:hypothetical protein